MFFYMASSGQKLCVVEGTEYVYEAYTDYKPLDDLKQELNSLQTEADNQKKQLTNLTTRLDQLVAVPEKKDFRLVPALRCIRSAITFRPPETIMFQSGWTI